MVDDLKDSGPRDRFTINMTEAWEVEWWSQKWAITPGQLKAAVAAAGPSVEKVAEHLGKSNSRS